MNHEFCIKCGFKNLYEVSKPKFCSGCAEPLNSTAIAAKVSVDEEPREVAGTIDIQKLKASIKVQTEDKNKTTLDDLWKDPAPRSGGNFRNPSKDPTGKAILKQTEESCAPAKAPKDVDER
ncbi:hypothetical protein N9955_00740 [bacterium]|nr:hypothetical protein [bacterium]